MSAASLRELPSRRIILGAEPVAVRVRSSRAAKTIRLRVGPEHPLEVIVPVGTSDQRIDDVLAQRTAWIASKLNASRMVATRAHVLGLDRPGVVWLDGKAIPILFGDTGRSQVTLVDAGLRVEGEPAGAAGAVSRWYRREARLRFLATVDLEGRRLGLDHGRVAVRDQRTRWGSCSPAKNLAFNWRLVLAPVEVQQYVVVHELCHIRIRNHRKEFWRLIDAAMPGWREPAAWLREHGHELRDYTVDTARCTPRRRGSAEMRSRNRAVLIQSEVN